MSPASFTHPMPLDAAQPAPPPLLRPAGVLASLGLHAAAAYLLVAYGTAPPVPQPEPEPVLARLIQAAAPQPSAPRPAAFPVPPAPAPPAAPPPPRRAAARAPQPAAPRQAEPQPVRTPAPQPIAGPSPAPLPAAPQPPAPAVETPPPAPQPPAEPALASASVACPNADQVRAGTRYPAAAQRRGISGRVTLEFIVSAAGAVEDIRIVPPADGLLASAAVEATRKLSCVGAGRAVKVRVSYDFQMR